LYLNKEVLVLKYKESPSKGLREKIVQHYTPLIEYISRKLAFNRHDLDDLFQVGTIGLLRALERYSPEKETDFTTFATPNIIGEIKHYFRDKSRLVKVPRKLQESYSKIKQFIREKQKTGKAPTIKEIATALECSEEKVLESMEAGQSTSVLSLDAPSNYTQGNRTSPIGSSLLDTIGVAGKEEHLLNKEIIEQAVSKLNAREKKIIFLRFYSGLSQTEIAKQLDLSQMHISRLLVSAIKNLKKVIETP